jgi:NADH-quinone oxidoreductase subunit G
MSDSVRIEIDGRSLEAPRGSMVMQVADQHGIYIPRFCYHHKLSIAANCRMCLVEVEKSPKPLPACATPVTDGMKVYTRSPRALAAQKATMEFLLINHPLDCPVCDQGGECELQDLALGYGRSHSRYDQRKRVVGDEDIGPLVSTDMTRCIYCSRCVRFMAEVAGQPELGIVGRGEHSEVRTALKSALTSEVSANIIDLCPVGALNSKPFRFRSRSWDMLALAGLALHDGVGSHLHAHTLRGRVMRVVPREAEEINEIWLADRDRYSYLGLDQGRQLVPLVRDGDALRPAAWEEALERAAALLARTRDEHGPESIAVLASPSSSLEEGTLLVRLAACLGVSGIDHRLWRTSTRGHALPEPTLGSSVPAFAEPQTFLMVGCHLRLEAPVLNLRVRRAVLAGGTVHTLNPCAWSWNYPVHSNPALGLDGFVRALAAVEAAVRKTKGQSVPEETARLAQDSPLGSELLERMVRDLLQSPPTIVAGETALSHPDAEAVLALIDSLAEDLGGRVAVLAPGANARGLHRLGLLPGGDGSRPFDPWSDRIRARLVFGFQPEYDLPQPSRALNALERSDSVHITTHLGPESARRASVVLPLAAPFETPGGWMSLEGRVQEVHAAVPVAGESRPGWRILRDLGERLGGDEASFPKSFSTLVELRSPLPPPRPKNPHSRIPESGVAKSGAPSEGGGFVVLRTRAPYACDPLLRHAAALQETVIGRRGAALGLNPEDARRLGLAGERAGRVEIRDDGGRRIVADAVEDPAVPPGHVHLPIGSPALLEAACVDGRTVHLSPAVRPMQANAS